MAGQESPQPLPSLGEQEAGRREQRGPSQRHAGRQIARAEPRPAGPSAAPPLFRGEGRQEGRHRGPPRPSLGAGGGKGRRQRAAPYDRQREQSPAAPQGGSRAPQPYQRPKEAAGRPQEGRSRGREGRSRQPRKGRPAESPAEP